MSSNKYIDSLIGLSFIFVIFPVIPMSLRIGFLGGEFSAKASFYTLFICLVYSVWLKRHSLLQYHLYWKELLYITLLGFSIAVSLVHGLINFPYYDLVPGTNYMNHKLEAIIQLIFNESVSEYTLSVIHFCFRVLKNSLTQLIFTFGFSYLIFYWYKNRSETILKIVSKGSLISASLVVIFGVIELFYFGKQQWALSLLTYIRPIVHAIEINNTWWPPLFWPELQFRSLFPEPSFLGIYTVITIPFIWSIIFTSKNKKLVGLSFIILLLLEMITLLANSRTATVFLIIDYILLVFALCIQFRNKKFIINTVLVTLIGLLAFVGNIVYTSNVFYVQDASTKSINTTSTTSKNISTQQVANEITSYGENNIKSLSKKGGRSNNQRYGVMKADLDIFKENPLLGIGQGLRTPYVLNHLDEDTLNGTEVKMWIENIKNKGLINISIPMLGEYTSRLSETGIMSFVLFMAPILLLLFRLLKYIIQNSKDTFVIFFTIAYIECLLTGIGTTLNELYYFWILLGFGYALVYVKNSCNNKVDEISEY
ncbi:MAG: O-antigen ligase family protein [Veillonella sp.]|uniref:O-antigen ligase family protein n=1 Tax=Veillonella sp. TaxID=1926307 RepID=UPI001DB61242|nr:O-antigen ligase family protein [Veillonella sp.]MBS7015380.1 O-antigen ligase family protein [Veillonella sp.]